MYRHDDDTTIHLGDLVRDRVSGLEGVATGRATHLNKCVQVIVEPRSLHEGKPAEGFFVDEEQVDVVARGVLAERTRADAIAITLGSRVRDKVSGFEGIVVVRTDWIGGSCRYEVRPVGAGKEGKPHAPAAFWDVQLDVLDATAVTTRKLAQTGGAFDVRPVAR